LSKILVADDEEDIRNLVGFKLRRAGHEVIDAANGEEALAQAVAERFDLIILDWSMPVMTGLEACEALRAQEGYASTPIFILTAHTSEWHVDQSRSAGATEHLAKPFSPRALVDRVNRELS
jgi:DNA-binding response OmpR family regulator